VNKPDAADVSKRFFESGRKQTAAQFSGNRPKPTGWKARATWHGLSSPCRAAGKVRCALENRPHHSFRSDHGLPARRLPATASHRLRPRWLFSVRLSRIRG
jgi:hypothetical protein